VEANGAKDFRAYVNQYRLKAAFLVVHSINTTSVVNHMALKPGISPGIT